MFNAIQIPESESVGIKVVELVWKELESVGVVLELESLWSGISHYGVESITTEWILSGINH